MKDVKEVGKILRAARKRKQMTLKKLAKLTHVHFNTIGHAERGARAMTEANLISIIRVLDVGPEEVGLSRGGVFFGDRPMGLPHNEAAVATLTRLAHEVPEVRERIVKHLTPVEALTLADVLLRRGREGVTSPAQPAGGRSRT